MAISNRAIHFVTYHAHVPEAKEQELGNTVLEHARPFVLHNIFTEHKTEYEQFISMLFASARLLYPEARCDVLTDADTEFQRLPPQVSVYRYPADPALLMQNRLHAQIEFLKSLTDDGIVCMLDSDILINRRLDRIEQDDAYAIMLTVRQHEDAPINGGVFIISGKRRNEAIAFLERVAEIHQSVYQGLAAWGGNQFALRDAVAERSGGEFPDQGEVIDGVLLLPAASYNFTPPKGLTYSQFFLKRKGEYLLHFKGARKKVMRLYFHAFLQDADHLSIHGVSARGLLFIGVLREALYRVARKLFSV